MEPVGCSEQSEVSHSFVWRRRPSGMWPLLLKDLKFRVAVADSSKSADQAIRSSGIEARFYPAESKEAVEVLMTALASVVYPGLWEAEGGEGVIVQVGSKLFIRQSSEIHQAIIDFIRELKFVDAMTMEAVSSRLSLIRTWLISFNRDSIPATVLDSVTYMLFSNSRIVLASLHA